MYVYVSNISKGQAINKEVRESWITPKLSQTNAMYIMWKINPDIRIRTQNCTNNRFNSPINVCSYLRLLNLSDVITDKSTRVISVYT